MTLRVVLVNHCHPRMKHVGALRFAKFAEALAGLGHRVVLLCETLGPEDSGPAVDAFAKALADHDWSRPFVLACRPKPAAWLASARRGRLPWGLRQAVLATHYVFRGGVFGDWRDGARPYLQPIVEHFRPEAVWATFGNTDAWNIGRELAARAGCPWVADMKDNWGAFLPFGLRRLMASRYGDAAHMTVFSEGHGQEAARWFGIGRTVVYSGFDDVTEPGAPGTSQTGGAGTGDLDAPATRDGFRLMVTGSVYGDDVFAELIDGAAAWLRARPPSADRARLIYAGNDCDRVGRLTAPLRELADLDIRPFLVLDELRAWQARADVNVYVTNRRCIFHHKVLELLAAGRPVLCFPPESAEALEIAAAAGATLHSCASAAAVAAALDSIAAAPSPPPDAERLARYAWRQQARTIERLLSEAGERR